MSLLRFSFILASDCHRPSSLLCFDLVCVIISSSEHEVLKVSYCDQSMFVVRRPASRVRRASRVMRRQPFALKAYSPYSAPSPGHILETWKEALGTLIKQNSYNRSDRKSKIAVVAAILNVYFSLLLLNQKATRLETW